MNLNYKNNDKGIFHNDYPIHDALYDAEKRGDHRQSCYCKYLLEYSEAGRKEVLDVQHWLRTKAENIGSLWEKQPPVTEYEPLTLERFNEVWDKLIKDL